MSWWKIKDVETGMVDFKAETAAATTNAIPGKEDVNCLFNGDGPADIMGAALRKISAQYEEAWDRPVKAKELRACFNFCFNGMFKDEKKK